MNDHAQEHVMATMDELWENRHTLSYSELMDAAGRFIDGSDNSWLSEQTMARFLAKAQWMMLRADMKRREPTHTTAVIAVGPETMDPRLVPAHAHTDGVSDWPGGTLRDHLRTEHGCGLVGKPTVPFMNGLHDSMHGVGVKVRPVPEDGEMPDGWEPKEWATNVRPIKDAPQA